MSKMWQMYLCKIKELSSEGSHQSARIAIDPTITANHQLLLSTIRSPCGPPVLSVLARTLQFNVRAKPSTKRSTKSEQPVFPPRHICRQRQRPRLSPTFCGPPYHLNRSPVGTVRVQRSRYRDPARCVGIAVSATARTCG